MSIIVEDRAKQKFVVGFLVLTFVLPELNLPSSSEQLCGVLVDVLWLSEVVNISFANLRNDLETNMVRKSTPILLLHWLQISTIFEINKN